MSPEEISGLTGLDPKRSRLASQREYDEPCIVLEPRDFAEETFRREAGRRGLNLTLGGRFYHLHAKNDKGKAVERLINWYGEDHPEILSIGLGDSPNDFSMLERVNYPVLIRSSEQYHGLDKKIPGLRRTREPGPKGWNLAVLDILSEIRKGGIS
jgi:mannosyl-3-phosphoglycerate phosphatase